MAIDPGTATVAAALIGFSGKVLVAVISKHASYPAGQTYPQSPTIDDEEVVKKIMGQAQEHFRKLSSHIQSAAKIILNKQAQARIEDAIDGLQAQVSAVMAQLRASAAGRRRANLYRDGLIAAIIPLRANIYKAQLTLSREGREDIGQLCYLTGASALLSVLEYLGTPEPTVLEDLKLAAKRVQKELLDVLAYEIIANQKGRFPWEDVQQLLEPDGAERLADLYKKNVQTQAPGSGPGLPIDVKEAVARIKAETKLRTLKELKRIEETGANRTKVINAIDRKMREIRAIPHLKKMLTKEEYDWRLFSTLKEETRLSERDCRRLLGRLGAKKKIRDDGSEMWKLKHNA